MTFDLIFGKVVKLLGEGHRSKFKLTCAPCLAESCSESSEFGKTISGNMAKKQT